MEDQSKLRNKYQQKDGAEGQLPLFGKKKWELSDAERVFSLQCKLYQKAKQDKGYKFYVLYDKVFQKHMLSVAWKAVKANQGSPGIDGISINDIEQGGVENYLEELGEELRTKRYRTQAVKRVMIPKANGGERPLGIPTVRDRIVQTACKLLIEPIFEADFEESSYGFRPERSSGDALGAIKGYLQEGKSEVLDADLSKYFDTIPHDKLLIGLKERISDGRILDLIGQWLKAPIYEDGQFKGGKKNKVGTPQGGVISPLLANIYLNLLDRIVNNPKSLFYQGGVKIVRYADDFVLMGKQIGEQVKEQLKSLLSRMGLSLNEQKTRTVEAKAESFDFLGFTIRYDKDLWDRNKRYWNIIPSQKSEQKIRDKIDTYLEAHGHYKGEQVSEDLNKLLRGWLNYFDIKGVSYPAVSKRRLRHYLQERLNRYYNRKSQRKCRLYGQRAFEALVEKYGLIDPTKYTSGGVRL
ncbi:group II intron reverse transcriptase/maturase [Haliscomenobacter hydrossis]|uniref:RNA-directed DNA polymerase (Reverse transcriptase) n=1 Tax=Haliscomenobacter hydrossis (strain ATCC 27775 / DSM 1100 / LMG 10767 / O) TaxID=760192 RepID=F4L355_HALH1|nr:group II intron reverse transcriptase/maturase [Haliscomenobacter hydrossis]AEE50714.1 RNA-directed DNA polymerase (Reverse transcriptase) [Haliscomenobacter hydrossis DSM 1100]